MDSFENWWQENRGLYELTGVKKYVAQAIWNDACSTVSDNVLKIMVRTFMMEKEELEFDKNLEYPVSTRGMTFFRPTMAQLLSEATKYANLGNIVDAVKEYKENESPLDIQLRKFRQLQNKL